MNESNKISDLAVATMGSKRKDEDVVGMQGLGTYCLTDIHGDIKQFGQFYNLITDRGDEFYAKLGIGTAQDAVSGMRLGTGTTAVAKNGAGAAIVTYVTGSAKALDTKAAATKGAALGWRVEYVASWAAGVATATGISEVVITNQAILGDVAGTAADTISRALLSPTVNKGADDTLTVTWNHDFLGA